LARQVPIEFGAASEDVLEPTLMVIGLNHRTAPAAVRERFGISEARRHEVLVPLARAEGIEEVLVLATCYRTEFFLWANDAALAANSVFRFLSAEYGLKLSEWEHFYRLLDDEALLHIFRVASSLDAMALSEPQIVAQFEAAWQQAQNVGSTACFLDAVMQKALTVSRRATNEANEGIGDRASAAAATEKIVAAEALGFRRKLLAERVVPTIIALRNRLDEICRQELNSFCEECGPFSRDQDELLQAVTSRMTQRIAGSVARELKELSERVEQEQITAAVQRLFHLQTPEKALAGGNIPGETYQRIGAQSYSHSNP